MPDTTDWQDTLWREWKHTRHEAFANQVFESLADGEPGIPARLLAVVSVLPKDVATALVALGALTGLLAIAATDGAPVLFGLAVAPLIVLVMGGVRVLHLWRARTWLQLLDRAMHTRGAFETGTARRSAQTAYDRRWAATWWRTRPDPREVLGALAHPAAPNWARELADRVLALDCSGPGTAAAYIGSQDPVKSLAGRVGAMRLGARALPALARTLVDGPWVSDAREVMRHIARVTVQRFGRRPRDFVCPECFTRYRRLRGAGAVPRRLRFVACPLCLGSADPIDQPGPIAAVLDSGMAEETALRGGCLRVNWLRRAARRAYEGLELFDFDRVEIARATDEEVRHLLVDVVNDTDETRRKRYRAMECAVSCELTENTLQGLREVFGAVTAP